MGPVGESENALLEDLLGDIGHVEASSGKVFILERCESLLIELGFHLIEDFGKL